MYCLYLRKGNLCIMYNNVDMMLFYKMAFTENRKTVQIAHELHCHKIISMSYFALIVVI